MQGFQSTDLPKISVIIAVYNSEEFIGKAIDSFISQTYPQKELVIVDGGSNDRTLDIINTYNGTKGLICKSGPDEGIFDAWNKGLKMATGQWLVFLGADDFFWSPDVFEQMVPNLVLAEGNGIRYVYGKLNYLSKNDLSIIEQLGEPWELARKKFTKKMTLAHCGSFHHRSLFEIHGQFDTTFKVAGDYEFLLREFKDSNNQPWFIDDIVVVGMRSGGVSGNLEIRKIVAEENEKARKLNNLNSFSADIFFWKIRINMYFIFQRLLGEKFAFFIADFYRICTGKKKRWTK